MNGRPALASVVARVRGSPALIAATAAFAATVVVVAIVSLLAVVGARKTADIGLVAAVELPMPAAADLPDASPPLPPAAGVEGGLVVPPYTAAAFASMPPLPADAPLPTPRIEPDRTGNLPNAAADTRPSHVYARPFDRRDDRARLVVIVLDIGLSRAASEAAIRRLPGAAVLAIDAYAAKPAQWVEAARAAGHEVLVTVPLKTDNTPGEDAGPRALPLSGGDADSPRRLQASLDKMSGYVGVLMRGKVPDDEALAGLRPVLDILQARGLLLVDAIAGGEAALFQMAERLALPRARLDAIIGEADAATVDRQLAAVEAIARERFVAVVGIRPTPTTLDRLRSWISRFDQSRYVLAPVSAVAAGAQP